MKQSTDRILTTHVGSLARPHSLLDIMKEREFDRPYDVEALDREIADAVKDRVRQQVENGIDIVADGEMSKVSFLGYVKDRLGGFEVDANAAALAPSWQAEFDMFPEYYTDYFKKYSSAVSPLKRIICKGPISYTGQKLLQIDIDNLKAACEGLPVADIFMPACGPSGFGRNDYYKTYEEYLYAVGDAMREEYLGIIDAGFILQVDDPWLTDMLCDPNETVENRRRSAAIHVEAVNHALRGIPEDRVRFHTCYSVNIAPRVHDFELRHFADLMLKIRACAYLIEGANPRHEHEWQVWQEVKLPDDKILVPGVVSHCIHLVEHPELVAQRIERFAGVVGRERVIAGTDCGFGTSGAGDEVHPDVAWAKLRAMVEGARIASRRLF